MALILGLAAAFTYGAADFVGGLVTKRTGALLVVFWSQLAGAALLVFALPLLAGHPPTSEILGFGVLAGFAGGVGVVLLYRGLSIGRMSVVAPVTAVGAATLPLAVGLALGERPSAWALAGVVVALAAAALVSMSPGPAGTATPRPAAGTDTPGLAAAVAPRPMADAATPPPVAAAGALHPAAVAGTRRPGVREAVGAGLAFGLFFIFLERSGVGGGLWPLVGARIGSIGMVLTVLLGARRTLRPTAGTTAGIMLAGGLDMAANLFYLLATRVGLLSLVAVLTSLYPAATVLLARMVLGERLSGLQLLGLGCALAGVVLIGLG